MPADSQTNRWAGFLAAWRLATAHPRQAASQASRFLTLQPAPVPGIEAIDRTIFLLEAARSELATQALRFSRIRFRAYPLQFFRFVRANIHLWLVVKAVEAVESQQKEGAHDPAGSR
jgi:hypothetical protein